MKPKVAVVGAGISGLACAYDLENAGCDVEVYESNDYVGGRMATRVKNGLAFDIGTNFFVKRYHETKRLCDELKVPFIPTKEERHFVYKNGRLHQMIIDSPKDLLTYELVSWGSRLRLAWFFLRSRKLIRDLDFFDLSTVPWDLDKESVHDFAKRALGQDVADYVADGMTSTYQFHRCDELSVTVMLALAALMSTDPDGFYQYHTVGEMSALPEAIARKLKVHLKTPVESVDYQKGKVVVAAKGKKKYFDAVVLACTANRSFKILKSPSDAQTRLLKNARYSSTITVGYKIPQDALKGISSVWVPWIESKTICSYSNEAIKGQVYKGETLVDVWLHESYAKTLIPKSDKEIYAAVAAELRKFSPHLKDVKFIPHDLQRWECALPKYDRGYVTKVREFLESHQGGGSVYLCGDYLDSPWVEGSLRCGQRVAKKLLEDFKRTYKSQ